MARGKRRVGRGPRRGPGGGGEGALKRLKLAVEEFVQATSESETPGGREGPRAQGRVRPGGRKSRRELRKEKRHLRKARRLQRTAGPSQGPGPGGGGAGGASGPRAEATQEEDGQPSPRRASRPSEGLRPLSVPAKAGQVQARGPLGRTKAPAAAAAARKRALLAANEEEDREIRKLERCLGLNKRRKKGDGSSVPPSFSRDGLDYILGALDSGKSSGWYESSSEEEEEDAGQTLPESDTEDEREEQDVEDEGEREAEAGAQSEEEDQQDVGEGQREAGGAEGRAKEEGRKKRVRFAEDEERSENPSEDVDADDKVLDCEQPESSGISFKITGGAEHGTEVTPLMYG